jgi:hypothetical protein
MPQSTAKIGYAAGAVHLSVDDSKGDTSDDWAILPITLIYTDWLMRDIRFWTDFYYYETDLDASTRNVGQNVERYGLRLSLQKSLRVSPLWAPWFGIGLDVSQTQYSDRHTVDEEGFLLERYADRDETAVSLIVNVLSEWSLTKKWSAGVKLEQAIPINADITDSRAYAVVLYKY